MPQRFELATGNITMNTAVFVYNEQKKSVELVKRVNFSSIIGKKAYLFLFCFKNG